jgi:hypothetical protein
MTGARQSQTLELKPCPFNFDVSAYSQQRRAVKDQPLPANPYALDSTLSGAGGYISMVLWGMGEARVFAADASFAEEHLESYAFSASMMLECE